MTRRLLLLAAFLMILGQSYAEISCGGDLLEKEVNCGYVGRDECERRGCCYVEVLWYGVPQGRYECLIPEPQTCAVGASLRMECGWGGITHDQCKEQGCCYDSSVRGAKWCFERVREKCLVNGGDRRDCGWGGITKKRCEAEGCCFNNAANGVAWCFHPKA